MHEDICETVEVVSADSPTGFIVINKSDYDPDVDKIFGSMPEAKPSKGRKG